MDGRLNLDQWTDASGHKRSKHSVTVETMQMIDGKSSEPYAAQDSRNEYGRYSSVQHPSEKSKEANSDFELEIKDDSDIPF